MKLSSLLVKLTRFSQKNAWAVIAFYMAILLPLGFFAFKEFRINTDTADIIDPALDWRKDKLAFEKLFPIFANNLLIVVDDPTPLQALKASEKLKQYLVSNSTRLETINIPGEDEFFQNNGLLFLNINQIENISDQLNNAQPILATLAADNSLRGFIQIVDFVILGVKENKISLTQAAAIISRLQVIIQGLSLNHKPQASFFDSMELTSNLMPTRQVIFIKPVLDFGSLAPGKNAVQEIQQAIQQVKIQYPETNFRITGSVALADDEFSTVAESNGTAGIVSFLLVLVVLFIALRSWQLILAVVVTLLAGLLGTTIFAIFALGPFNIISIAFFVLFVGLAVDFGIQYCVRFRKEWHDNTDLNLSLLETSRTIGSSLILAALLTSLGFFSFIPTPYLGVAELGLIAGGGMMIAVLLNLTLLPALLSLLLPARQKPLGAVGFFHKTDAFISRSKWYFILLFVFLTIGACWLLPAIRFDANPLNLKDPKTESMATLIDLYNDPIYSPYVTDVFIEPNVNLADTVQKLEQTLTVSKVISLQTFVPKDQTDKLLLIDDLKFLLRTVLDPVDPKPTPTAADIKQSLLSGLETLKPYLETDQKFRDFYVVLQNLSALPDDLLLSTQQKFQDKVSPLLLWIKKLVSAKRISESDIPQSIRSDWVTADGFHRLTVYPAFKLDKPENIEKFLQSIKIITPHLIGLPTNIIESSATITYSFMFAAILALSAAILILFFVLKNMYHVLYVLLAPLMATCLTGATCVLLNIPINLANIITTPLQLGIGIAFTIYYVMEWRNGEKNLISSSITWAIIFSALTTGVAFGSLAISSHPGTADMGLLLAISLLYTLMVSIFFLPAFLLTRKNPQVTNAIA